MKFSAWAVAVSILAMIGLGNSLAMAQTMAPAMAATESTEDILTPPEAPTPRINGPTVFGVRSGNPVLYSVPATGTDPITFSATGLPSWLSFDSKTGQLTGTAGPNGDYVITLHAQNSVGSATKAFHVIVGDTISLTPALGWNSWNCWAGSVDQDKVLAAAKAMVSSGLAKHGWTYINTDDTWQGQRDATTHALQANEKFPDMKGLCDQIHAMGLKAGIYSTPWIQSYAGYAGGSANTQEGTFTRNTGRGGGRNPLGTFSFTQADAKQWATWGFDYLKYDWNPNRKPEVDAMGDALRSSGRDIVYSLSNAAPFGTAFEYSTAANSWRTTGDIRDNWASMSGIGFNQAGWAPFTKLGHFNDPDMLVVGYVGWSANLHASQLTHNEQYTHISLWCLLSAPLLIGCDLNRLDPFTLNLLTNDEVLAVDQDSLCQPALLLPSTGNIRVFAKTLSDGSQAVGLFNIGPTSETAQTNFTGTKTVHDLWRQKDLGKFDGAFSAIVPSHGVVLVKIGA